MVGVGAIYVFVTAVKLVRVPTFYNVLEDLDKDRFRTKLEFGHHYRESNPGPSIWEVYTQLYHRVMQIPMRQASPTFFQMTLYVLSKSSILMALFAT